MGYKNKKIRYISGTAEHICKCENTSYSNEFKSFNELKMLISETNTIKCSCGRKYDITKSMIKELKNKYNFNPFRAIIITKSGVLFHSESCLELLKSKNMREGYAGDVHELGYEPCGCITTSNACWFCPAILTLAMIIMLVIVVITKF